MINFCFSIFWLWSTIMCVRSEPSKWPTFVHLGKSNSHVKAEPINVLFALTGDQINKIDFKKLEIQMHSLYQKANFYYLLDNCKTVSCFANDLQTVAKSQKSTATKTDLISQCQTSLFTDKSAPYKVVTYAEFGPPIGLDKNDKSKAHIGPETFTLIIKKTNSLAVITNPKFEKIQFYNWLAYLGKTDLFWVAVKQVGDLTDLIASSLFSLVTSETLIKKKTWDPYYYSLLSYLPREFPSANPVENLKIVLTWVKPLEDTSEFDVSFNTLLFKEDYFKFFAGYLYKLYGDAKLELKVIQPSSNFVFKSIFNGTLTDVKNIDFTSALSTEKIKTYEGKGLNTKQFWDSIFNLNPFELDNFIPIKFLIIQATNIPVWKNNFIYEIDMKAAMYSVTPIWLVSDLKNSDKNYGPETKIVSIITPQFQFPSYEKVANTYKIFQDIVEIIEEKHIMFKKALKKINIDGVPKVDGKADILFVVPKASTYTVHHTMLKLAEQASSLFLPLVTKFVCSDTQYKAFTYKKNAILGTSYEMMEELDPVHYFNRLTLFLENHVPPPVKSAQVVSAKADFSDVHARVSDVTSNIYRKDAKPFIIYFYDKLPSINNQKYFDALANMDYKVGFHVVFTMDPNYANHPLTKYLKTHNGVVYKFYTGEELAIIIVKLLLENNNNL